jgi:PhnB protein
MAQVKAVPPGYTPITPYLVVKGAAEALDFYTAAFGAMELFRMPYQDGRVGHAEMEIDGARFMLADEFPEMDCRAPRTIGGTPVHLYLYVPDVDGVFGRAVTAGAVVKRAVQTQFYGDRSGALEDPFGHVWHVATHVEDVAPEELQRRSEQAQKDMAAAS